MEASTLTTTGTALRHGHSTPLLRLASDERLVALTRRGNQSAFEALVARYQARLLAFCRHMLNSREDAEDVLQEVFAAAFNAMIADERTINVRPWLYRIARNRSLNHLRKATAVGVDSMDVHMAEHGTTTAEKAHRREEFRMLMADVQTLPETQRTALLLREIDALSYDQIAEAMDTTIPSVKSLLVRARVSLAEMSEARDLSCDDVRDELGEVAEGIRQRMSAPVRRHLRDCERCSGFRKQLRNTNKALAAVFPIGPLLFLKKTLLAQLGTTSAGGAAVGAGSAAASGAAGGALGAVASKTMAGLTAAAIVTAGAVEVQHSGKHRAPRPATAVAVTPPPAPVVPEVVASRPQAAAPVEVARVEKPRVKAKAAAASKTPKAESARADAAPAAAASPAETAAPTPPATTPAPAAPAEGSDVTTMPAQEPAEHGTGQPAPQPKDGSGQTTSTPTPTPAPAPAPAPAEQSPPPEHSQEQPPPAETTTEPAPEG